MGRKCAIYNRISVGTSEDLAKKTCELIDYCVNTLGITEYVVFEEISPVNDTRIEFNDMMNRIKEKEFTDALTFDFTRYYRYNNKKLGDILQEIDRKGVTIHFKNNNSIMYIRKQQDGEKLEEQKNKLQECGDNLARFLECDTDVYIGLEPENNKIKG